MIMHYDPSSLSLKILRSFRIWTKQPQCGTSRGHQHCENHVLSFFFSFVPLTIMQTALCSSRASEISDEDEDKDVDFGKFWEPHEDFLRQNGLILFGRHDYQHAGLPPLRAAKDPFNPKDHEDFIHRLDWQTTGPLRRQHFFHEARIHPSPYPRT